MAPISNNSLRSQAIVQDYVRAKPRHPRLQLRAELISRLHTIIASNRGFSLSKQAYHRPTGAKQAQSLGLRASTIVRPRGYGCLALVGLSLQACYPIFLRRPSSRLQWLRSSRAHMTSLAPIRLSPLLKHPSSMQRCLLRHSASISILHLHATIAIVPSWHGPVKGN